MVLLAQHPDETFLKGLSIRRVPRAAGFLLRTTCDSRSCRYRALSVQEISSVHLQAQQPPESVPELCRHEVVEYRVDCGVQIQHDSREVEDIVVVVNTQGGNRLRSL